MTPEKPDTKPDFVYEDMNEFIIPRTLSTVFDMSMFVTDNTPKPYKKSPLDKKTKKRRAKNKLARKARKRNK